MNQVSKSEVGDLRTKALILSKLNHEMILKQKLVRKRRILARIRKQLLEVLN